MKQYNLKKFVLTPSSLMLLSALFGHAKANEYIVPPMVNIPKGEFMMGSEWGDDDAKPIHRESVDAFQMAKYPVTVAEFRLFVQDSGYKANSTCNDHMNDMWFSREEGRVNSASWDKHRFQNNEYQPVTCVNWQDAKAYAKWLSAKTGIQYRLPTEQEWEYAEKANTTGRFFWGDDPNLTQACSYGNFADKSGEYFSFKEYGASYVGWLGYTNCDDGEPYNSIVGLYRPNPFGLYDMVGNVSQYLDSCYYPGYQARTTEEMDLSKCNEIAHRSETWHFPPQPHAERGKTDRIDSEPWALMGFRLVADGHSHKVDASTRKFELALAAAQQKRINTRPKILDAPASVQLIPINKRQFQLSWQSSTDTRVQGYEVYKSTLPHAHLIGPGSWRHYKKVKTVEAKENVVEVTLPPEGGSYRLVAIADSISSLPSQTVSYIPVKTLDIPGRILMQDMEQIDNAVLAYSRDDDAREPYYISNWTTGFEQTMVTASFKVNVKKSAWYKLNFRANTDRKGEFFKLWQGNKLVSTVHFDPEIDDKTSQRHRVYLEAGNHDLQISTQFEGWAYWNMTWLELTEISS